MSTQTFRVTAAICAALLVGATSPWLSLHQYGREGMLVLFGLGLAAAGYGIGVRHFDIPPPGKPLRVLFCVAAAICLGGTLLVLLSVLSPTTGHLLFTFQQLVSIVTLARGSWSTLARRQDDLIAWRARQRLPFALATLGVIVLILIVDLVVASPLPLMLTAAQALVATLFIGVIAQLSPKPEPLLAAGERAPDRVARIEKTISPDLYRQAGLTVHDLAEGAAMTVPEVRDTIRHDLGFDRFSLYLDQLRVHEAKTVLQKDLEASELSGLGWYLGYASNGDLARAFKALTGETPGAYRRRVQSHSAGQP